MKYDIEIKVSRRGEGVVTVACQMERDEAMKQSVLAAAVRLYEMSMGSDSEASEE